MWFHHPFPANIDKEVVAFGTPKWLYFKVIYIYFTLDTTCLLDIEIHFLSDNARENRAKVRIGDIFDLDGPSMDGTHYPRYLQGQKGFGLWPP